MIQVYTTPGRTQHFHNLLWIWI